MSFLQPWLLLGALGVLGPLLLHLRARTGPVLRFPTLRFLEDQPQPRPRGFRLRDVLLFLARAAAVLLVALGFAWPYRPDRMRVTESRVHVLDNTLSRRAEGRFDRDREQIRALLRGSDPGVQDAVIELQARPRTVVGFADDRAEADRRLAALRPSSARGSYLEALRLAQSVAAQGLGARRRIVVYSDGQENQWTEHETVPPFLEGVEVELAHAPDLAARPNVSLAEATVRRVFEGAGGLDVSAELRWEGGGGPHAVRMTLDGVEVLQREVDLPGDRGLITLQGRGVVRPDAWVRGELTVVGGDALPDDDRVSFAVPPVHEGRLRLFARSAYLKAALSPATMRGRWALAAGEKGSDWSAEAARLADGPEADLPDVAIVDADHVQSDGVRRLVLRCLNNGRGVLLLLGRTTPLVSGFLHELGLEAREVPTAGPESFRFLAGEHPVFRPFVSGDVGDLLEVRIRRHLRVTSARAVPLAYGTSGDPLVLEGTATRGRLLVIAFALDRTHTDWPLLPTFVPFLDLALQHLRAAGARQTAVAPGGILEHVVPVDRSPQEVVLRAGGRVLARARPDATRRALLTAPDDPGLYEVTYDGESTPEAVVAVNPSPHESVLRYAADPPALRAWAIATPPRPEPAAAVLPGALGAGDQRLWWWLLVAAAAALALESGMLLLRRDAA